MAALSLSAVVGLLCVCLLLVAQSAIICVAARTSFKRSRCASRVRLSLSLSLSLSKFLFFQLLRLVHST